MTFGATFGLNSIIIIIIKRAVENLVKCRICDSSFNYSGGKTNLTSHVNRHHLSVTFNTKVKVEKSRAPTPAQTKTPAEVKQKQPTLPSLLNAAKKYPFNFARAND